MSDYLYEGMILFHKNNKAQGIIKSVKNNIIIFEPVNKINLKEELNLKASDIGEWLFYKESDIKLGHDELYSLPQYRFFGNKKLVDAHNRKIEIERKRIASEIILEHNIREELRLKEKEKAKISLCEKLKNNYQKTEDTATIYDKQVFEQEIDNIAFNIKSNDLLKDEIIYLYYDNIDRFEVYPYVFPDFKAKYNRISTELNSSKALDPTQKVIFRNIISAVIAIDFDPELKQKFISILKNNLNSLYDRVINHQSEMLDVIKEYNDLFVPDNSKGKEYAYNSKGLSIKEKKVELIDIKDINFSEYEWLRFNEIYMFEGFQFEEIEEYLDNNIHDSYSKTENKYNKKMNFYNITGHYPIAYFILSLENKATLTDFHIEFIKEYESMARSINRESEELELSICDYVPRIIIEIGYEAAARGKLFGWEGWYQENSSVVAIKNLSEEDIANYEKNYDEKYIPEFETSCKNLKVDLNGNKTIYVSLSEELKKYKQTKANNIGNKNYKNYNINQNDFDYSVNLTQEDLADEEIDGETKYNSDYDGEIDDERFDETEIDDEGIDASEINQCRIGRNYDKSNTWENERNSFFEGDEHAENDYEYCYSEEQKELRSGLSEAQRALRKGIASEIEKGMNLIDEILRERFNQMVNRNKTKEMDISQNTVDKILLSLWDNKQKQLDWRLFGSLVSTAFIDSFYENQIMRKMEKDADDYLYKIFSYQKNLIKLEEENELGEIIYSDEIKEERRLRAVDRAENCYLLRQNEKLKEELLTAKKNKDDYSRLKDQEYRNENNKRSNEYDEALNNRNNIKKLQELIINKKVAIIGGQEKWFKSAKETYPEIIFKEAGDERFNLDVLRNAQYIFIDDKISHQAQKRVVNYAKGKKIKWGYLDAENLNRFTKQLLEKLSDTAK